MADEETFGRELAATSRDQLYQTDKATSDPHPAYIGQAEGVSHS